MQGLVSYFKLLRPSLFGSKSGSRSYISRNLNNNKKTKDTGCNELQLLGMPINRLNERTVSEYLSVRITNH